MKAIKRITAGIIAIIQILGITPAFAEKTEAGTEILFQYTGDKTDDSKWSWMSGVYEVTKVNGSDGNVLWLNNSEIHAGIEKSEPINSGNVVVSYDLRSETVGGYAYHINARDEAASMSPSVGSAEGRFGSILYNGKYMGLTTSANTLTINSFESTIEAMMWKHIDLWMNFDNCTIELYVDGKFIAEEPMNANFTSFYGFGFISNRDSNSYYMDNVYIGYVPTGEKADFDFCMSTPPEASIACYAEILYEPIGHIYTNRNVVVTAELENVLNEKNEISYEYKAVNKNGHTVYTEQENIILEPKEKKSLKIEFDAKEYGFFDSSFKISDLKSGNTSERASRFSVIRTRTDEKRNKFLYLNAHYQVGRGTDEVDRLQKLFADMGVMGLRESAVWIQYEAQVGVYALDKNHLATLKAIKDNKQNLLFYLGGSDHRLRNITFPKTEAELAAWKKYVEEVVQDVAPYGVKDFELLNEPDLTWGSGKFTSEEYVNLMKATYPIIHKYVPDGRLFVFSCARNYSNFIEECLAIEGCIENFDGISYHPYDSTSRPEEDNGSTKENSFHEYIAEINGLVEKWGLEDKALVISEYGYTSSSVYISEEDQARWVVRASCYAYDHVEYMNWFMNIEKIDQRATSDAEYRFGWLRPWKQAEILYEAKPVIPAVAQYASMITEEAQSLGNQEILDGRGRLYRYKNDGQDIYMAWTVRGEEDFAVDIDASQAVIYDMYGNSHTQKTDKGILYLHLSESPQYITGDFTKCVEKNADAFFVDGENLEVGYGDTLKVKVEKNLGKDEDYKVELKLPTGAEVVYNKGFKDGKCEVGVSLNNEFIVGSVAKIYVTDKNGVAIYQREMPIHIVKSAETELDIQYIDSGRWKGVLKINNTSDKNISGALNIIYPQELAKKLPSVKISETVPNMTRLVEFNLPLALTSDFINLQGEIVLNNGEKMPVEKSSYFTALLSVNGKPKIDGVIEKGEYDEAMPIIVNKDRMVVGTNGLVGGFRWDGPKDLSGKGYINYDKDYFYLAMEVEDDIMGSNDKNKRIWANDSIQFSFAERNEKNAGFTEIGIGIVDDKPAIARYYYMGEKENIIYHESIGAKEGFEEDTELMISRNGTKTIYELKIPWVDIYPTREPFAKESVFFSIIINENDLNGREGWLEFAPGIGAMKDPALFTSVMVMK